MFFFVPFETDVRGPPGTASLLPQWNLTATRDHSFQKKWGPFGVHSLTALKII